MIHTQHLKLILGLLSIICGFIIFFTLLPPPSNEIEFKVKFSISMIFFACGSILLAVWFDEINEKGEK